MCVIEIRKDYYFKYNRTQFLHIYTLAIACQTAIPTKGVEFLPQAPIFSNYLIFATGCCKPFIFQT